MEADTVPEYTAATERNAAVRSHRRPSESKEQHTTSNFCGHACRGAPLLHVPRGYVPRMAAPPTRLRNAHQPTTKASLGPPCDVWPQDAYPPTIHRRRSNSCARMSACRLSVHTTMELWAEALWATCAGSKRRQPIRLDPSRLPPVSDRKLEICGSAVE